MRSPEAVRVPEATYGHGLLNDLKDLLPDAILVTMAAPYEQVRHDLPAAPAHVHFVETMEQDALDRVCDGLPVTPAVVGLGGGLACDTAKYLAWKLRRRLVLVPTVVSEDAFVTRSAVVRVGRRVRSVGDAFPERLLVDFDLVRAAPAYLNRAGVGNLLSIPTALWDWRFAREHYGEEYHDGLARQATAVLDRLETYAQDLHDVTETGIRTLVEGLREGVRLCEVWGNSRPEEGSEHSLAYCLEAMTGRAYLHGALVTLMALVACRFQDQDWSRPFSLAERVGVPFRPPALGISREDLANALQSVHAFVHAERLPPGIFHRSPLSRAEGTRAVDWVFNL